MSLSVNDLLAVSLLWQALVMSATGVYAVSNIQINSEDGRQHFIELNLKTVDVDKDVVGASSCVGCTWRGDDLSLATSNQHWVSAPPTFTLMLSPGEIIRQCDSDSDSSLPYGVCGGVRQGSPASCSSHGYCDMDNVEDLADIIEQQQLMPMRTEDAHVDHRVAMAVVLLNLGHFDKAIHEFTSVLTGLPTAAVAYFGRGVANARKGLQNRSNAEQAFSDFSKAIQLDAGHTRPDIFVHRAEVLLRMKNLPGAHHDVTSALSVTAEPKMYFLRGVISLLMENFDDAEKDFRNNLECTNEHIQSLSHFHLGLALFYRGKVRNAVEVFKEVLKKHPDHMEASLSLAQGFRELGNIRAALSRFNQTLQLQPQHGTVYQLRAHMMYDSGDPRAALLDFEQCVRMDPNNGNCQYMQAASKIMLGQFYDGVKDTTKLMVRGSGMLKAPPEYIKAIYLREYARYIHRRLDSPVSSIRPDTDFSPDYLHHWTKLQLFDLQNYKEQPGLRPDIRDLNQLTHIPPHVKVLVCWAETVGQLSQVSIDGLLPNKRLNLAMGLASIHIAQHFQIKWKQLKNKSNSHKKVVDNWRELFHIAVYYRRLASLDQPFLWVDSLPDFRTQDGYRSQIPFVRGSTVNTKMAAYFELAFKLAKTMLEYHSGDGAVVYPKLQEDIARATTCQDLLQIAKKRNINPHGFLVSTQVPSCQQGQDDQRLAGGVLELSQDLSERMMFALNIINSPDRTASYASEMNHLLALLQEEIRKLTSSRTIVVESIVSNILSIMYYFLNLLPLTRGSSAVAYSVVLGIFLSLGWQITGRIPHGRLLDVEAMLAGAPDAFVLVVKSWMSVNKTNIPMADVAHVWEVLPTVGSVLEVLAANTTAC